jgi:alkanesulfonate monooxygenase SsuD/methylene tetrahydromethanopterin reductase-like flavin-dependent oxidoreductase (luciferase family)
MRLALRYDMRSPSIGAPAPELYEASIEQCAWADALGFETVYLAEHHGADDGYCPSPIVQATAIAARTKKMVVHFSALLAVLHNPIRLAEDLAILDIISKGRIALTLGLGYRPHEYLMFGIDKKRRVRVFEDNIAVLKQAWTGEPFDYRGMSVVVRPTPVQPDGPPLYIGGSSEPSALRAARMGDGYVPATDGLYEVYADERRRLGLDVPPPPPRHGPLFLFVTEDPERAWNQVGPHVLYTTNSNAEWAKERGVGSTPYPPAQSVDDLKSSDAFAVVTPDQCVDLAISLGDDAELWFQPLMGGLPPEIGWSSLELFASAVLPRLRAQGLRSDIQDGVTVHPLPEAPDASSPVARPADRA